MYCTTWGREPIFYNNYKWRVTFNNRKKPTFLKIIKAVKALHCPPLQGSTTRQVTSASPCGVSDSTWHVLTHPLVAPTHRHGRLTARPSSPQLKTAIEKDGKG